MPSKIFLDRIKRLERILKAQRISSFLVTDPIDLFYLTGIHFSLGHLFIAAEKSTLFVDNRYLEIAKKQSPIPVELLREENLLKAISGSKSLCLDGDKTSYSAFLKWRLLTRKAGARLTSDPLLLKEARLIKDKTEIKKMEQSAKLAYAAYTHVKNKLKPGVAEKELAFEFNVFALKNGASGTSFDPIVAFGPNTALPHYRPQDNPKEVILKKNDIALFDVGVVLEGYCSDMTRVCFIGNPDPKLKMLFEVTLAAQKAALAKCRPGVFLKELDKEARKVMAKSNLEEYFIHGLGHGIGLEVHEPPHIRKDGPDRMKKLEEGMLITIEPGLYLPGIGGVRYEDTILITREGYVNLYPNV